MRVTQAEPTTDVARDILREPLDSRILIVDGYDVKLSVRGGQLHLDDGISTGKRKRIISRADRLKRIVILAETGYITLDALRWTEQEGISIAQFERDGRLVMASGPAHTEAKVKKMQALVSADCIPNVRLETARTLLIAKLEGQADNAFRILNRVDVANFIDERVRQMVKVTSMRELTGHEGMAAREYWKAWAYAVHVPFSPRTLFNMPAHWTTYRGRALGRREIGVQSVKNHNRSTGIAESANRAATDPINAMLNYAYKVAETEAILACSAYGIDPAIGFMHSTDYDRNAMALDLLEVARPVCDRVVLSFLDCGEGVQYDKKGKPRYFQPEWCYEAQHGLVRLEAPLTHMIVEQSLKFADVIFPHVSILIDTLAKAKLPTGSTMSHP